MTNPRSRDGRDLVCTLYRRPKRKRSPEQPDLTYHDHVIISTVNLYLLLIVRDCPNILKCRLCRRLGWLYFGGFMLGMGGEIDFKEKEK